MIMGGFHCFTSSSDTSEAHEMTHLDPLLKGSGQEHITKSEAIPVHPLEWEDVISMVEGKQIMLPTENEIQDKSKSDWLAKTLVVLQTSWFVMQCIARRVEHLPTTELEIITLAYAVMNFAIFVAWWDKPHNVGCPIRVFQSPSERDEEEDSSLWSKILTSIVGSQDQWISLHRRSKVPIFYAGSLGVNTIVIADFVVLVIGVVFGAIHCIAWFFSFHIEAVLWRASSLIITSVPLFIFMIAIGVAFFGGIFDVEESMLRVYLLIPMAPLIMVYVAARFITIVLAFMNLFSLPPGAFEAVAWTIRIPHLA